MSQKMASLPSDRVTAYLPPFSYTGIDCFGPLLVKHGRKREKRYGCIFTCLNVRAIHLEKLHSLDADSFINALNRFIARRGKPSKMRSDNGTNFVGANKEIQSAVREWNASSGVTSILQSKQIEWQFNPPLASHMGGVWERQIRTVRKIMNVVLLNHVLDDERLDSVFCEIESIVNSRPLTAVSDDPWDFKPLTPNDLLLIGGSPNHYLGASNNLDCYGRRWRHVQLVAAEFWKRWIKEYLPTLQVRRKWQNESVNLRVGDIVLLVDYSLPRCSWALGRVTNVFPGSDNLVRSAQILTKNSTVIRPISKLAFLESGL